MKIISKLVILFLAFFYTSFPQNQYIIMNYNLLNYPGNDTTSRNPYFRTTLASVLPDILVVQEMTSLDGVNGFLQNVLQPLNSNYAAGIYINGPDTDNEIFYKSNIFTFLNNTPIQTDLRDISQFKLLENNTLDTIYIYALHLKASEGSDNELQRKSEVDSLRKVTDNLPPGSFYIVTGDFNIYGSNQPAYSALLDQTTSGYFEDIYNLSGTWNDPAYSEYHTQSTRTRQFGGGSTGGMDDRFDMILMSPSIINQGGVTYVQNSYTEYGNDGNHYNDSINQPPNAVVSQQIANALHYSSDHLPVYASFQFVPQEEKVISITALIEGFYNGSVMMPDTVTVELHNNNFPFELIDQTKIFLDANGTGSGSLNNIMNGTPYYIVLKHRNAVETWSAAGQIFSNNYLNYNFTESSNKAFGNNLTLIGTKWCLYVGDINQDGFIETADLNQVYLENVSGAAGYINTDLNGDNYTEIEDLYLVFINNVLGVEKKSP